MLLFLQPSGSKVTNLASPGWTKSAPALAAIGLATSLLLLLGWAGFSDPPIAEELVESSDSGREVLSQSTETAQIGKKLNDAPTRSMSAGPATVAIGPTWSVSGQCLDRAGRPVPGARIFALPPGADALRFPLESTARRTALARDDGRFALEGVMPQSLLVATSTTPLLSRESARVLGQEGGALKVTLTLEPARLVEGTSVDAAGSPVARAQVELHLPSPQPRVDLRAEGAHLLFHRDLPLRALSGADGRFTVLQPLRDRMFAWASREDMPEGRCIVRRDIPLVIRMANTHNATFAVQDQRGVPLSNVRVEVWGTGHATPWVSTTDTDGQCRFGSLPGARYFVVRFERPDLETFVTLPGADFHSKITLRERQSRTCKIVSEASAGIPSVRVRAFELSHALAAMDAGFDEDSARALALILESTSDAQGQISFPTHGGDLHIEAEPHHGWKPAQAFFPKTASELLVSLLPKNDSVPFFGRIICPTKSPLSTFRVRSHDISGLGNQTSNWREFSESPFRWESDRATRTCFEIAADGFASAFAWASPGAPFALELHRARNLRIRIVDSQGHPLKSAEFACSDSEGTPRFPLHTPSHEQSRLVLDRRGEVSLVNVQFGAWKAALTIRGFSLPQECRLEVDAMTPELLEVQLPLRLSAKWRKQEIVLQRSSKDDVQFELRLLDMEGNPILNQQFRWDRHGPRVVVARPLRAAIRQGAFPLRWITTAPYERVPTVLVEPGGDWGQRVLALPIPVGESAELELLTAEGRRQKYEIEADQDYALRLDIEN